MKKRGFEICKGYENKDINLPRRKTRNSVGYDIEAAEETIIPSIWKTVFTNMGKFLKGENDFEPIKPTLVKTGIKSYFGEDEVLFLANRSSNPAKKGLILANSIGIVECDYYENPDNDGHLMYAFYNFFPVDTIIHKHDTVGQAYFQQFLIADNDINTNEKRMGGFGSTDNQNN
ncbi:MAG: dUTP diphosphatase [Clostridia bacterium]|nr:dUTP diphosphatase [Clostridia bacterium]